MVSAIDIRPLILPELQLGVLGALDWVSRFNGFPTRE